MRRALSLLPLIVLTACGGEQPARAAAPATSAPSARSPAEGDRRAALEALVGRLRAAAAEGRAEEAVTISRGLLLPDPGAFFRAAFGREVGERLGSEYEGTRARIDTLPSIFPERVQEGQSEILVERFDRADDDDATGYQATAIAALRRPTALYSVRFVKPGERTGFHLWSFVFVDGMFRFVDKMRSVDAAARAPELAALGELRRGEARRFLETGRFEDD